MQRKLLDNVKENVVVEELLAVEFHASLQKQNADGVESLSDVHGERIAVR
jgi:hypothetical protein